MSRTARSASPTSFGDVVAEIFTPAPEVHQTAANALRLLADNEGISPGFRLALQREIVQLDEQARRAERDRGVCWSGLGGQPRRPRSLDEIKAEGAEFDANRAAYLATSEGKARRVIAKACAECAERNLPRIYSAFEAVATSLSRGDADPQIWVDRLQGALAAIDDQDVSDLKVLATELRVYVAEVA